MRPQYHREPVRLSRPCLPAAARSSLSPASQGNLEWLPWRLPIPKYSRTLYAVAEFRIGGDPAPPQNLPSLPATLCLRSQLGTASIWPAAGGRQSLSAFSESLR